MIWPKPDWEGCREGGLIAGALLLAACTAPIPADVERVAVEAMAPKGVTPAAGVLPAGFAADGQHHPLRVAFASQVNRVRFVTFHSYSLSVDARFCDAEAASDHLTVSDIYWPGVPLTPGGPDPIEDNKQARDELRDWLSTWGSDVEAEVPDCHD